MKKIDVEKIYIPVSIDQLFKTREYCFQELHEARKIFTSKKDFTIEKSGLLRRGLGMMYLYCPEEIRSLVESHIIELDMRTNMMFITGTII